MLARAIVASVFILGASLAIDRASLAESVPPRVPLAALPLALGEWNGRDLPAWDDRVLDVLGADDYVNRRYLKDSSVADLYVGYYRSQRQGDSIHSPQNCLPGAGWQPVESDRLAIRVSPDRSITVNKYIIQKDLDRQVVLYWFQGRGRVVANEYANRAYLVFDSLRTRRSDGALVRVMAPVFQTTERSSTDAAAFAAALYPRLSEVIP
ncbi:MAG TPA: EpsI family protein [Vicinamibacterales bacterium]|nr:EpsI family protein [Vicinamibacterales bacterium]